MTIRVFECFRSWDQVPVTIFARELDEAGEIYRTWVLTHFTAQPAEPISIFPFGDRRLEVRPLLDTAAALDSAGIGDWDTNTHSWFISAPQDDLRGELAPPEGRVGFYEIESDEGDDAKVFAMSFEEATALYCEWHRDRWGENPIWFTVHKRSRWELTGELATLRDGLADEIIGVAELDIDGVLRILPAAWEPDFRR